MSRAAIIATLLFFGNFAFAEVTFHTVDRYDPVTGRITASELNSISQGNITGYTWAGQSFVVYNGVEYSNLQVGGGGYTSISAGRTVVALRGSNLLMQEYRQYMGNGPIISLNNQWQSNSGWSQYRSMSNGGNSDYYLRMFDFSEAGTSIGTNGNNNGSSYSNKSYFFDANGNPTEISAGADFTYLRGVYGNDVVGSSGERSFSWRDGTFTDIFVPGSYVTRAEGIYENLVIGHYSEMNNGPSHGFLFDGSNYFTIDVPGATNTYFNDISGNQAVGYYTTADGMAHGFVANSVPEVSSLSLLALGGVVVALRRRR